MLFPGDHVVEYVDAYLHDALPHHELEYVARHLETCRVCRVAMEEARARLNAMQALPVERERGAILGTRSQSQSSLKKPTVPGAAHAAAIHEVRTVYCGGRRIRGLVR